LADDFDDEDVFDDFFDDFFFLDFFFLDFFFLVFFLLSGAAGLASVVDGCAVVAGFDSVSVTGLATGFGAAFGATFTAGLRVPGARNFGDEIDPGGAPPELDVHGGPPIMPHACASRISLFADVTVTSAKATRPSTNNRSCITTISQISGDRAARQLQQLRWTLCKIRADANPAVFIPHENYALAKFTAQRGSPIPSRKTLRI